MKPRIIAFSISSLDSVLREVSLDYLPECHIEIVSRAYEDALAYAQQRYQTDTADVFLAAGSNGAFLKGQLDAPLVLVQTDGFDLMRALATARQVAEVVGLVTYGHSYEELAELKAAFGMNLLTRVYRTPDDARTAVRDLVNAGAGVIVGPGLVNEIAHEYGVESVLSYSRGAVARAIEEAIRLGAAKQTASARSVTAAVRYGVNDLLGHSKAMQQVRQKVRLYANSECSVLIQGDTGTGKEVVAHALHAESARAGEAFIALNCGALTESLLESELFGYEEGAFTGAVRGGRAGVFESAHRGTVFLDEIGDMPLAFQTRLLRVLEEGAVRRVGAGKLRRVDFRLIAASHRDLKQRIKEGLFREDLYHRLNELHLFLPPLAERTEDIELLAGRFLRTTSVRVSKERFDAFLARVMPFFTAAAWPGNVRQLRQMCRRAGVLLQGETALEQLDLTEWFHDFFEDNAAKAQSVATLSEKFQLANLEQRKALAQEELQRLNGNVAACCKSLNISRSTLWRVLKR